MAESSVDGKRVHPCLSVESVEQTLAFYRDRLGFKSGYIQGEPAQFAILSLGDAELHFQSGTPVKDGIYLYLVVDNADQMFQRCRDHKVEVERAPKDQPYGLRDFSIRDCDGHLLVFGHHIQNGGAKILVERVDVQLRLEKRLALIVEAIAAHKKMTVGEMMEEMILHSFEPVEHGGMASPHDQSTVQLFSDLKTKHDFDHDAHDSYCFSEES